MSVATVSVTVTTSPTLLSPSSTSDDAASGYSMVMKNSGSAIVYLGGSGVDTTGFPLAPGDQLGGEYERTDSVYGVVASGTSVVNVLRVGV